VMRRAGYVRAQFGETRAATHGDVVTVTVPVEEGELYRLGRVTIEGAAHFDAQSLRELLPLRRGDIADTVAVGRWAYDHLRRKYADEGFIQYEADIEPEYRFQPGAPEGVLNLTVTVNEGKRFRLRSVEFEGPADAPFDVLREALGLKGGEFFRQQEYVEGVAKLNNLDLFDREGRFEDVDEDRDVEFRADEEAGELDLKIHLTEKGQERKARRGAEEGGARPGRPTLARRP
jgi:outer membrane protein insertion porin family